MFSFHTPFTPPTTEEDKLAWLRLIRSPRVGNTTFFRLMGEHGSAAAALSALPQVARAAGVQGYLPASPDTILAEIDQGTRAGARLVFHGAPDYPPALAAIADPPPVLWARGQAALIARPAVAVVGARSASSLGLRMARALAAGLGDAGYCIVSGLARGIDAAAHEAALPFGTIAVCAGGVDVVYPSENAPLAARIVGEGLLLSEQPIGLQPQARHFPRRNRIVAGLGLGVVLVEAAVRSGSLITARDALELGREVMAVPGHPFDSRAGGCNALLRDGAVLIRGVADVIAAVSRAAGDGALAVTGERATADPAPAPGPASQPASRAPSHPATRPPAGARPSRETGQPPRGEPPRPTTAAQPRGRPDAQACEPGQDPQAAAERRPRRSHDQGAARAGSVMAPAKPLQHRQPGPWPAHARGSDRNDTPPRPGPVASRKAPAAKRPEVEAAGPHTARPARGPAGPGIAAPSTEACGDTARAILARLSPSPLPEDHLIRDLARPAAVVATALLELELSGHVQRQPGGLLSLAV